MRKTRAGLPATIASGGHVPGHDAAGADHRPGPNGDATQQRRSGTNGRASLDMRRNTFPIRLRLQFALAIGGARDKDR